MTSTKVKYLLRNVEMYVMTGEQNVVAYARQCIISQEAIKTLASDGFTSIEAIQLLDTHDMKRYNIPMGQQKLILAAVI